MTLVGVDLEAQRLCWALIVVDARIPEYLVSIDGCRYRNHRQC